MKLDHMAASMAIQSKKLSTKKMEKKSLPFLIMVTASQVGVTGKMKESELITILRKISH